MGGSIRQAITQNRGEQAMSTSERDTTTMIQATAKKAGTARRNFLRMAALMAAAPILSEADFAAAATTAAAPDFAASPSAPGSKKRTRSAIPKDMTVISANENPLGPCKAACEAIASIAPLGGRYDQNGETDRLVKVFAEQNKISEDSVAVFAGSGEPLHFTVLAFTGPGKGFVTADPSYEAPMRAADVAKAKITKVPLTKDYAHDVKAMVKADPTAGVIYICNPNNPTGTLTKKEDIVWALENKPAGSILLVDEAYIHLSETTDVLDLVAAGKDLIVLRTFSKIYGMAGIRCGFAVGRPDLIAQLDPYGRNAMPITGSIAARVSLEDAELIPTRRKQIAAVRADTIGWLKAKGYKVLGDSQSNCFMIDTGRDGKGVIAAMRDKKVLIGRTWPIWPNAVRITVGLPEEMEKFKTAWTEVMTAPPVKKAVLQGHDDMTHMG
jgi:histidinol-phosphate aminotransferase